MTLATMTHYDSLAILAGGAVCLAGFASWLNAVGDFFWMATLRGRLVMTTATVIIVLGAITVVSISRIVFAVQAPSSLAFLIILWMVPVLTRCASNKIAVRAARKQGLVSDVRGKPLKTLLDVERRRLDDAYSAPIVSSEAG